jgi:hypothetical protein
MQQISVVLVILACFHNVLLFICTSWINQSVEIHIQFDITARNVREHLALIQIFMQKLDVRSKFSACLQMTRRVELNLTTWKRVSGNYLSAGKIEPKSGCESSPDYRAHKQPRYCATPAHFHIVHVTDFFWTREKKLKKISKE